jgi:sugar phosphate isomerase/epimerase
MDFALSSYLFVEERLNSHVLDKILAAGIRHIEIFAARQHLDYHDTNHVRDVAQWFGDHNVTLHSVHAPMFTDAAWGEMGGMAVSVAHTERRLRIESTDEIKRSLEIAERLPFRYLVVHLGLQDEEYDQRKFDAAFSSLEHLRIFAKDRGVQILLENIPNELSTAERLLHFIRYTRLDFKICFDTGHAHMGKGVQAVFRALRDYIVSTHVHDNGGAKDDHLLPFEGTIDWQTTVRDLKSVTPSPPILFELNNYGTETKGLSPVERVIERITALGGD